MENSKKVIELLRDVPVCRLLSNEVTDNNDKVESINKLYYEVKLVLKRSFNCSMAAYRSRIVQITYLYNSMAVIFNFLDKEEQTEKLKEKIEWVEDEINSMWECHNEW